MTVRPILCAFALLPAWSLSQVPSVNVLTQHNDIGRTGQNLNESVLNTSNVQPGSFGMVFTRPVDGQIYAQPLYVQGLTISGALHNVVFVATMHDSLYAFDADDPNASAPLWHVSFIDPPAVTTIPYQYLSSVTNIVPEVGILSTPAIDLGTNTIFVVVRTLEGDRHIDSSYVQRLHAINILTGAEQPNSPVVLSGQVPGTGAGSDGTYVYYNGRRQNQRPGLLILNGTVYIAAGSHGDYPPYHGWVLGYNEATLQQNSAWCSTPNGSEGGIWMSGEGLAADSSGFIYLATGNGVFDQDPTLGENNDYGDSFVKLDSNNGLVVADFFTPDNQALLAEGDLDLGASGPMLIPGTNYAVGGGKQGTMYLMDVNNMAHYAAGLNLNQQTWQAAADEIHGTPCWWTGPNGPTLYVWSSNDCCKAFTWSPATNTFSTTPQQGVDALGRLIVPPSGHPGGILSLSANGSQDGTGILWAVTPYDGNADPRIVHGILRAFDAQSMKELWNSKMSVNDDFGWLGKFAAPTIANGKVFLATFSNELAVYGLLPNGPPPLVTGVKATPFVGQVTLSWNIACSAQSYNILRALPNGPFAPLASGLTTLTYTDTGLTDGQTYLYEVQGVNSSGVGQNSAPISATPNLPVLRLYPIANAFTRSGAYGDSNFGGSTSLSSGMDAPDDLRNIFLTFDISQLYSPVQRATLQLYGSHSVAGGNSSDSVYGVSATNWLESAITWNTQPAMGAKLSSVPVNSKSGWRYWDVTSYLQSQSGNPLMSLGLQMDTVPSDSGFDVFQSREASAKPSLLITMPPPPIYFPSGFASSGSNLAFNGKASINGNALQVTDGGATESGAAWFAQPVNVSAFHCSFSFQMLDPTADGFTFTIQNVGPTAIGHTGGGLGYQGIKKSVCLKFDLHNNAGEGQDSTGLFVSGVAPTVPAIDLTYTGLDLHSQHVFNCTVGYGGGVFTMNLTDPSSGVHYIKAFSVNLPSVLGSNTAYVGFTGGTGPLSVTTQILSWVFGP